MSLRCPNWLPGAGQPRTPGGDPRFPTRPFMPHRDSRIDPCDPLWRSARPIGPLWAGNLASLLLPPPLLPLPSSLPLPLSSLLLLSERE